MSDIAVRIENASKRFKLYHNPVSGPVKELLFFWKGREQYKEFMAVKDVSLEVRRGEVIGIIGPNGAGKTTLLKMIAGLLPVEKGRVEVNGKVTALLALGVGVHPEFTGRENILYGGMLLGMSKAEVTRKMASIIEFSELGDFVDRPFRTYSTGMRARLLFSISMSIDPDILIVDEALATGDAYFVGKCTERIRGLCSGGATIIFVSHNLRQVEQLCRKAHFMADGRIRASGEPSAMVSEYHEWTVERQKALGRNVFKDGGESEPDAALRVTGVRLLGEGGGRTDSFKTGDKVTLLADYENPDGIERAHFNIGFYDCRNGAYVAHANTFYRIPRHENGPLRLEKKGTLRVEIPYILLVNGSYAVEIMAGDEARDRTLCRYRAPEPMCVMKGYNPLTRDVAFMQPCSFEAS